MSKWIAEFELEDGDTMPEHMDLEYKGARIDFHCRPLEQEPITILYLMHKEMDIPILECQKAYDVAMEYLRSQTKVKG